jgi:pyruvate,orthophosphate dikinase
MLAAVRAAARVQPDVRALRGVRLGIVIPGLFEMQVRAILEAFQGPQERLGRHRVRDHGAAHRHLPGARHRPQEALKIARQGRASSRAGSERLDRHDDRAAAGCPDGRPDRRVADFFSFGTNDLTQTTWGFSRDDVEGSFFSQYYLDKGIFQVSPFETLDRQGVGRLVKIAVDEGRATKPGLKTGVCGEHGGDPDSVHFFHEVGSRLRVLLAGFRVPVATGAHTAST